jgi:hypothetical protein
MLVTDNEDVAVIILAKDYLPPPIETRWFTARNMVRLAAWTPALRDVPVVTQGIGCKVQVTYDGLQWTIREVTS